MSDENHTQTAAYWPCRPKVLLSAYACEPGKGSEPGTGWNLAMALAEEFDVTVLTRSNNRDAIEARLKVSTLPKPLFIYHDLPVALRFLKRKGILSTQAYYTLWQHSVGRLIPKHHDLGAFDLLHHITFNTFEVAPGLLGKFPGIKIWGPVGGGQRTHPPLLAVFNSISRLKERLRSVRISLSRINTRIVTKLKSCDLVLFANEETRDLFEGVNLKSSGQMIDVGVDTDLFVPSENRKSGNRIFSASNFEARKGTRLLLLAFQLAHQKNPALRLRLAGDGSEKGCERDWVRENGLTDVIAFSGRRTHDEMKEEFAQADIFVFPSIRDTSGAIVLEAMACGLPVICLDHQGAKLMVDDQSGIKIKPQSLELTIEGMSEAILKLSSNTNLRESLGRGARERAVKEFSWNSKASRIANEYRKILRDLI
jgi:glycosyltransferase involved in cell wall biosynthesis